MPYKIRRKSDGLYSSGGTYLNWTKKGKVWSTRAAISNHIGMHDARDYKKGEYEVIELELVEVSVTPFLDFDQKRKDNRAKRQEEADKSFAETRKKEAQKEIERLRKIIGE